MPLTGNKGEWSEIYTLLKLLGEGKVYAGDQNLNKIQDLFYPIIMILRQEKEGTFNYKLQNSDVVIQTPEGEELLRIPASVFLMEAEKLLMAINKNVGAFAIPQIEIFMNQIHCHSLKAKSSDKTDIKIILHDRRTKMNSEMGFSIKSQLGGNSTLLNASKATNFNFKIKECCTLLFISFGGLSIHLQIKSILNDTDISLKHFFKARFFQCLLSLFWLFI